MPSSAPELAERLITVLAFELIENILSLDARQQVAMSALGRKPHDRWARVTRR